MSSSVSSSNYVSSNNLLHVLIREINLPENISFEKKDGFLHMK